MIAANFNRNSFKLTPLQAITRKVGGKKRVPLWSLLSVAFPPFAGGSVYIQVTCQMSVPMPNTLYPTVLILKSFSLTLSIQLIFHHLLVNESVCIEVQEDNSPGIVKEMSVVMNIDHKRNECGNEY